MTKHTSLDHPIFVSSYSFVLAILYFLIAVLVTYQIARIIYYKCVRYSKLSAVFPYRRLSTRHNLKGFQFGFLLFCWVWTVLRAIIWLLTPIPDFAELLLHRYVPLLPPLANVLALTTWFI